MRCFSSPQNTLFTHFELFIGMRRVKIVSFSLRDFFTSRIPQAGESLSCNTTEWTFFHLGVWPNSVPPQLFILWRHGRIDRSWSNSHACCFGVVFSECVTSGQIIYGDREFPVIGISVFFDSLPLESSWSNQSPFNISWAMLQKSFTFEKV